MKTIDRLREAKRRADTRGISSSHASEPNASTGVTPTISPTTQPAPCPTCGSVIFWQSPADLPSGSVTCWECTPPPRPAMVRGVWTVVISEDDRTHRWEPVEWSIDRKSQEIDLRPAVAAAVSPPPTRKATSGPPDARGREVDRFPIETVDAATWAERWARMSERTAVLAAANDRQYAVRSGRADDGSSASPNRSPAGVVVGAGGGTAVGLPGRKNSANADADVSQKFSPPKNAQDVAVMYRRGKTKANTKSDGKAKDKEDDRELTVAMYDVRAKAPAEDDVLAYTWAGAERWVRVAGR